MNWVHLELGRIIKPAKLRRAGDGEFPVLSMTMRDGLVDQADKFKKRVASADTSPYKVVVRNQLVVGFPIDEGVLAFQNLYDEAIVSPAYDVWDIQDSSLVTSEYLERFLRSPIALSFYAAKLRGTTARRRTLPDDIFLSLRVPLPTLAEQRRVVEVLDKAEALRAKRRAAFAQLDSLTQSLFLDIFGDPATNPKGWPHKTLFDLGKVVTGGTPPSAMADMFDGPIPFITPGDLESDEPVKRSLTAAGAEESRTVRAGATLVCCIGATIGKMGIAPVRSAFNQQLNAVEWFSEVEDIYGYATLRFFKPTIKSWGASTTLPILKKSSFEKIEIPVPPLPLQREFVRRFQVTEKLRAAQKASLGQWDELFGSLQSRAFKGELQA